MFIQTETTADPNVMKFLPGREVLASGTVRFADAAVAARSPLARRLFDIDAVTGVGLGADFISVTKADEGEWQLMKPEILGAIMEHFVAGQPVLLEDEAGEKVEEVEEDFDPEDAELVAEIKELLATRVRPAIAEAGGDIVFRGYSAGKVIVEMQGAAFSYRGGIENMLRHYIDEFAELVDYRDAMPKPGLETPEGKAIRQLLDERINPSVAMHGGHIALVDVRDDTAYIRLEGGCQGCGMADVTLKQGVEVEIKQAAPNIAHVLDVTDHAGGANPYYRPAK